MSQLFRFHRSQLLWKQNKSFYDRLLRYAHQTNKTKQSFIKATYRNATNTTIATTKTRKLSNLLHRTAVAHLLKYTLRFMQIYAKNLLQQPGLFVSGNCLRLFYFAKILFHDFDSRLFRMNDDFLFRAVLLQFICFHSNLNEKLPNFLLSISFSRIKISSAVCKI